VSQSGSESEQEFLAKYDASRFARPSVAVDVAIVTHSEGQLRALVYERDEHPAMGAWALPGGFVGIDEALDSAARRVLADKAGVDNVYLEQLFTFGRVDRDPRTRIITVAHTALVPFERLAHLNGGTWLAPIVVPWEGESGGPIMLLGRDGERIELAWDHAEILGAAVQRMRGKLDYSNIAFSLLPPAFTLRQLQKLHETISGRSMNKDSFRRRLIASGLVESTGTRQSEVGHRPAALYRFTGATAPIEGRH